MTEASEFAEMMVIDDKGCVWIRLPDGTLGVAHNIYVAGELEQIVSDLLFYNSEIASDAVVQKLRAYKDSPETFKEDFENGAFSVLDDEPVADVGTEAVADVAGHPSSSADEDAKDVVDTTLDGSSRGFR